MKNSTRNTSISFSNNTCTLAVVFVLVPTEKLQNVSQDIRLDVTPGDIYTDIVLLISAI